MNDILKTYMERFRENRHTLRRYTAFVLALAMITTLFVNWQLHGVGISMTAQYQCGEEEHTHTADCYTKVLTCGYEEGELENADELAAAAATSQPTVEAEPAPLSLEPQIEFVPHEHTEDCYTEVQTLTCMEEEHVHGDDCFDPEDGVTLRYYSRYGQSYGNPYGEWDVMFLSYCLKYAGIPQSAIPQEASVLALRSSMSDMDWLLDGEDGSTADVGDIVIYNKYVTRTVAVDSSADGAADGLDDLFSTDAEGENGAELEESGTAALDTVPATEDMTTLDTPDLPDIPDTANPEQPAAKPVDSADTAAPSVVSPAAEPQTTTVTDAQPVETVGIVSSVDSDAGTLTVISGDVDGKVAEVQLSFAEVLGVVDVAAAQYADTYGGQLPTISASRPNRAPALTAGGTTELQENWINKATATVNGKEHTIKDNYTPQIVPDLTVKDGGRVELTYHFTIPLR